MERHDEIKKGAWIGIFGNAFLASLKVLIGIITGSYAILADGIDTSTDIFTSVVILLSTRISEKPPDETHPYGHGKAETIASKIISFVMFYAGVSLLVESFKRLITGGVVLELSPLAFLVVGISLIGKTFLFLYKLSLGRRLSSPATISDALNMRNDILISGTVLAGMLAMKSFGWWLDSLLAIFVSILILKTSFSVFYEAAYELMDGLRKSDMDIYNDIFNTLMRFPEVHNPHRVRVRKVGAKHYIEMDIEVDGKMTVKDAHDLTVKIREEVMKKRDDIEDITIHVEPLGNIEREGFGVKRETTRR
ncbi:cation diffusion facilitator family transporter [Thermotoga sp. KOL6]|uniref:cation diffusion facilitator family transporter n=1 Tax=Thermotoga sp. KOL6 TaxID=126741 RepID=UPI000C7569B8|nr:cation diffusion facilitator family transporter [Thermotoga sp. KOL6]PLV58356.1 cation diffusion facilitator family transporter [Thermotoga sp. KOL6]